MTIVLLYGGGWSWSLCGGSSESSTTEYERWSSGFGGSNFQLKTQKPKREVKNKN